MNRGTNVGDRVISILFNPTARGEKAGQFRKQLSDLGTEMRVLATQAPGHALDLARQLVNEGCETLVAAGGDGTVHEVLNGLASTPGGLARCRLGVIPLGTANVFAKELGIPETVPGALNVLRTGRERFIDLPRAIYTSNEGKEETRYFIQLAGAGIPSRAIAQVDWKLKKRIGSWAYVWAGLQALYHPSAPVEVRLEKETLSGAWVELGSGRFYGGRYEVFPGAQLDDGLLSITILPRVSVLFLGRLFLSLLTRGLKPSSRVLLRQARQVILSCREPMPFHLDGDLTGNLPVTLTLQPKALRVIVP